MKRKNYTKKIGVVSSGAGRAKGIISDHYREICDVTNLNIVPGTLNINLSHPIKPNIDNCICWKFGYLYPCYINTSFSYLNIDKKISGLPTKKLRVLSSEMLRRKYNLENGSKVVIYLSGKVNNIPAHVYYYSKIIHKLKKYKIDDIIRF